MSRTRLNNIGGFELMDGNMDKYSGFPVPSARFGHCMASDDASLFLFGGCGQPDANNAVDETSSGSNDGNSNTPNNNNNNAVSSIALCSLWRMSFATHKWTFLESHGAPTTCIYSSMARTGRKVFVFGGTGIPPGKCMSNTLKFCTFENKEFQHGSCWSIVETNPNSYNTLDSGDNQPPRGCGQSFILHHDGFYTFGGTVAMDRQSHDLHKLNLKTMTWEKLCPSGDHPEARSSAGIAKDDDSFYLLGGTKRSTPVTLKQVFAYHIFDNRWETRTTLPDPQEGFPPPRSNFALFQVDDYAYICGGQKSRHSGTDDIWRLHLPTLQWQRVHVRLPKSLYYHHVVVSPSYHAYIFGGFERKHEYCNTMYRWRIPFHVARLSEMAWDVVCRSITDINKLDKVMLELKLGIPNNFTERL